jgi:hypothetical protein
MTPGGDLSPLKAAFCGVPLIFGKEQRRTGLFQSGFTPAGNRNRPFIFAVVAFSDGKPDSGPP